MYENRTIVWDFDGTILPLDPYDSEQTLLRQCLFGPGNHTGFLKRIFIQALIFGDRKQWLRQSFKKYYIRLMQGVPSQVLSQTAAILAAKIVPRDRDVYRKLNDDGYNMLVLSCGTANLSEPTLEQADLSGCFSEVHANRFRINRGRIDGMDLFVRNPEEKLAYLLSVGLKPEDTIAVGDGYTDIPVLDWAGTPVLIDRSGTKKKQFENKNYHFISSVPEILQILE
jgi:phosphoserine phosphatase